ncbi:hypothetical protein BTO05_08560 [Winogradskyella sp. PC-19]|uniref:glycosyltransferase family 4 protein n=1 Tax=Winogradskyella sp. PC-19 TaxID=754417 RepID=UPI000B3CF1CA|nr:glycosyltransferase family 4 protein [Winogradskyella sp. PC-19]ARV09691.1 hypothetical protein BTO05_08560 [Winogradskyella sp. PC-19]
MTSKKTILHICSDFCYTSLYFNLVKALDKKGVIQVVYVPLKRGRSCDNKEQLEAEFKSLKNVTFIFSSILSKDLRFRYFTKISKVFKDIESKVDLGSIDNVHAHFLYSDGGVAYKIGKKYGIPFITAVRNTDVNVFYKYFIHCRFYANKILNKAKNIIFISPAYLSFLENKTFSKNINELQQKTKVIPNGISDFWLDSDKKENNIKSLKTLKFIFVGELSENKNIHETIHFLNQFKNKRNIDINYTIIGPESDYTYEILSLEEKHDWVNYLGPIYDKLRLKDLFRGADVFVMLSKAETFGLVYVEAMSQGLPILYTKGQGIDGFFLENEVGAAIDIKNLSSEVSKIDSVINNYISMSKKAIEHSKNFNWADISEKYLELFKS